MRFCVVGAGAVGGLIGGRLAAAGHEVSALARGATLDALRTHGWRVEGEPGGPACAVSDDADALLDAGGYDVVVLAVKATALGDVAPAVATLLGRGGVVVSAMNGVPWWLLDGEPVDAVDPGGLVRDLLPRDRVLGGVVHLSAATAEPGVVRPVAGDRLVVGEARGGRSERAGAVVDALAGAGFTAEHSPDVRSEVWYKLWGNLTFNPISMLTGATADRVLDDPQVYDLCVRVMVEAARVGDAIGCTITEDPDARMQVARGLGAFRTSMLADADEGRPVELDALVTAVHEIGLRVGVPTPATDGLLGLARLAARVRGLYPT